MKTRELEDRLTLFSGVTRGEVDQRTRHLRDLSLIPTGPRGPAAPHVTPLTAALVVLCLVSRRASDAGPVMVRAMSLTSVKRPGGSAISDNDVALAPAVAMGLATPEIVYDRVEVLCDGSHAWVTFLVDGRQERVLFTDDDKIRAHAAESLDQYDATGRSVIGPRFVFDGVVASHLALEIAEVDGARWRDENQHAARVAG